MIVYIRFPGNMDVVYGRGGLSNNQEGNKIFRELIMSHKDRYESIKDRAKKNEIATNIVSQMRGMGSRFLQFSETANMWYDSGDLKAVEKTKQRFRELREPRVRNKIATQEVKRAKATKTGSGKKNEKAEATSLPKKQTGATAKATTAVISKTTPRTPANDLAATLPHRGIIGVKPTAIQKDRKSVAVCNSSVTASELDEEFRKLEAARSRMRSLLSSRVKEEDHRLAAACRPPLVKFAHQPSGSVEPWLLQQHAAVSMQDRLTRLYAANTNNRQPITAAPMPTPHVENLALRRSMMNSLVGGQSEGRTVTCSTAEQPPTAYQLGPLYDSVLRHPQSFNEDSIRPIPRPVTTDDRVLSAAMDEQEATASWTSKSAACIGEQGVVDRSTLLVDPRNAPLSSLGQHYDTRTQFSAVSNDRVGVEHTAGAVPDIRLRPDPSVSSIARWEQEKTGLSTAEPTTTRTTPTMDGEDSQDAMQNNNTNFSGNTRAGYSKMSCGSSMDMSSLFSELSEQFPDIDKVEHRLSHIAIQDLESETATSFDGKATVHPPHRQDLPGNARSKRSVTVEAVDVVFTGNDDEPEQTSGSGGGSGDNDSARSVLTMSDLGTADLMLDDDGTIATGKQHQPMHQHQQHRMDGYYRSESGRSLMSDSCFSSVTSMSQGR